MSWFKKKNHSSDKKLPIGILVAGGVIGIALILLGSRDDLTASDLPEQNSDSSSVKEEETVRYQEYLESRIEELCASMGLGEASAVVTLGGGFEEIYATEQKGENESYVIVGSGSSAQPLLLSRNAPEIMGIGVVCHAPLSPARQNELLLLLSATFHTPSNRICITGG